MRTELFCYISEFFLISFAQLRPYTDSAIRLDLRRYFKKPMIFTAIHGVLLYIIFKASQFLQVLSFDFFMTISKIEIFFGTLSFSRLNTTVVHHESPGGSGYTKRCK